MFKETVAQYCPGKSYHLGYDNYVCTRIKLGVDLVMEHQQTYKLHIIGKKKGALGLNPIVTNSNYFLEVSCFHTGDPMVLPYVALLYIAYSREYISSTYVGIQQYIPLFVWRWFPRQLFFNSSFLSFCFVSIILYFVFSVVSRTAEWTQSAKQCC